MNDIKQFKTITIDNSANGNSRTRQGFEKFYKLAPKFYCQDMIFSYKQNIFPISQQNNVNIIEPNVNTCFLNKLKNNESFSVARYNDGEWIPMLRLDYAGNSPTPIISSKYNHNHWVWGESGQKYVDDYLMPIIKSKPKYYIGISSQVLKKKYMIENVFPHLNGLQLCDGFLFVRLSLTGEMQKYFDEFKKRNVIVIGPDYCKNMNKYFDFYHVETPNSNNVWTESERISKDVEILLNNLDKNENIVLLYACSYVAKKLIDDFYHKYKNITQIDMGSAVCPYSDAFVRSYSEYAPL